MLRTPKLSIRGYCLDRGRSRGFGPYYKNINMDWRIAELMGYAYYAGKGYRIFVPLICGDGYDFIAEKSGKMLRVNVKVSGLKDKTDTMSWSISQASGSKSNASRQNKVPCDIFLVYMPGQNQFIELSGDFFSYGNSKSRRIPKKILRDILTIGLRPSNSNKKGR